MMSTIEPRFEIAESPVDVRSPDPRGLPVPIWREGRSGVPSPSIGLDRCAFLNVLHQELPYRFLIGVCGGCQTDAARLLRAFPLSVRVTNDLNSPKNQCVGRQIRHRPPPLSSHRTAYNRLVSLHVAGQSGSRIIDHRASQAVKHEPRGPVLASDLTLQLFGTQSWRMCRHQVGGPKPLLNAHMATMHRRAGHRRRTSPAPRALIPERFRDHPILPAAALRTDEPLRPPALRQIFPARSVRRKSLPKLTQRARKFWSSHEAMVRNRNTLVKCISILAQMG